MQKKLLFSLVLSLVLFFSALSCGGRQTETASVDENSLPIIEVLQETLPDYATLFFSSGIGYEIRNEKSNKVIITLGGGADFSGHRMCLPGAVIFGQHTIDFFLHLYEEYSFFVPEKFDWGRDKKPAPLDDIKARERYTVDNLITNYTEVISEYLSQNNYETVIIAGFSEGGFIVPELYFRLGDYNISGLVAIAAGGLPLYEGHQILYLKSISGEAPFNSEDVKKIGPHGYGTLGEFRLAYLFDRPRDSPEILWETSTYRWWNSMLFRKTIEFFKEINIPVLFLHGEFDFNVPVESTRYVEETLPDKPFTYSYCPEMWHYPRNYGEFMAWRRDIAAWLEAEGL